MRRRVALSIGLVEGGRWGLVLAACAFLLAVLGLTASLAWIPEVLVLGASALAPLLILGLAGSRAAARSGQAATGALAGALTGAIGGIAGGLSYVAYGKPALNMALGLIAGIVGGAVIGGLAGLVGRRTGHQH